MVYSAVGYYYLDTHSIQEVMTWIVQSFHKHTHFESENRLDLRGIREINRVKVCHVDMECVPSTIHQLEQGRHHSHSTL